MPTITNIVGAKQSIISDIKNTVNRVGTPLPKNRLGSSKNKDYLKNWYQKGKILGKMGGLSWGLFWGEN